MKFNLRVFPELYSIYKLRDLSRITLPSTREFFSLTVTDDEYSLISSIEIDSQYESVSRNWKCIKVDGELPFDAVGVTATLCSVVADGGVSLFAVCTHDRDFILVEENTLEQAVELLKAAGHIFVH
ncbi:hypothetical protein PSECIP111951_01763 [Pseudoalteromonas holothuriae]|uniref:CASTOR ACT domain-containing protein n=1 Tax=Pseudoalteromonas holothuriae TaxID=2963714 RepID=A0A9W4VRY2_9GAMM|nr:MULTISPECIES: ACT domain-containing protein [unclassified Pseudoalteromonas]CAH9057908.1 hypothetical protein PSECIP111951_01763 [Pseudoalteromonas sp. CIP111951]CAH9058778.1 hypothetical protein PSECIP111854_02271 [Pseudoalteromonas sp. CIP111854]